MSFEADFQPYRWQAGKHNQEFQEQMRLHRCSELCYKISIDYLANRNTYRAIQLQHLRHCKGVPSVYCGPC